MSESRRLDHLPHRFADRTEIAEVRSEHGGLEAGAASGARYRLAGRAMGRRLMGKAAFLDLEDRSGRIQLLASADGLGEELFAAVCDTQLGDVIGVAGEAISSRRGELTLRLEEFQLLAPCQHPLPDLHHGLADVESALSTALRRPDGQHRRARGRAEARAHDRRRSGVPRRDRLRRGGDADSAAALRRGERRAVHDASQRARPHVLPARGDRAVLQAPDRGRARARLRARQGLPQRGRVVQAQPRVHGDRVVRGLRRLLRRHAAHRGVRGGERPRRARHDGDHPRRPRDRHGAALAARPATPRRSARPAASTCWRFATPPSCVPRWSSAEPRQRRETPPGRSSSTARSRTSSSPTSSSRCS